MPRWTKEQLAEYETRRPTQSPVAKCAVRHEPLAAQEGKRGDPSRVYVCITSYRRRLIDPDNLVGKYFLDSARYCGWLRDDTAADVDYTIRQVKVAEKTEERTEIDIFGETP
jgi:hypothetical protein